MSGIVGIVNLNGAPVDQRLLWRMTDYLAFRGPDAQEVWVKGAVGFGHAMLRTTDESASEHQPFSFDGDVWITADARIDGREDLIRRLKAKGCDASISAPDVELILHAYQVWGEDCVEHLLGDFAFAIWDGAQQRLFCARDHFGIKPFFYAQTANRFIFSNALNCVRQHPAVADDLNELFIGDFLLFGGAQDFGLTAFAEIHRLPPAHTLTLAEGRLTLKRYWRLPEPELLDYRRPSDYVEHFQAFFREAVSDRLRTARVGVLMSGGLDSTAVAAIAHRLLAEQCLSFEMKAYTTIYQRLFPDDEKQYVELMKQALRIPVSYQIGDDYPPYEGYESLAACQPEPGVEPMLAALIDQAREVAQNCRVVLTGLDGDTVMSEWSQPYFASLFKQLRLARLLLDAGRYVRYKGQLPRVGFRYWLRGVLGERTNKREFPAWIEPSFAVRLNLRERWERYSQREDKHPIRPLAYGVLESTSWMQVFEGYSPEVTRQPVEFRHPFTDLRLINFLLATPPVPWLVEKEMLRLAMRGVLPEPVRRRSKTTLAGDPIVEHWRNGRARWIDGFGPAPELAQYVSVGMWLPTNKSYDADELWKKLPVLSLDYWLRLSARAANNLSEENYEYASAHFYYQSGRA